jgi:excisionase family DNA binding protein
LIKCSTWTLYEWCKRGVVPHIRVGRRLLRFRRSTLEAWLADREAQSLKRGLGT